ncbi:pleckstrin homology domain-containing family G member 1 [Spea bombifrons]|uniref:pleckstrin homology domain-containing family G member 1 n=1 Tax=Spea bombifrons TaxID=233779 RepID=UPI00234B15DF|nr:pleckstrin homology domain-containing family G member 1 [Spea bombifrons]
MPDKTPEGTESTSQNKDDYHSSLNALSSVAQPSSPRTTGEDLHRANRPFRYCEIKNMELSDGDRPVSFGSTSSSASSRDSHCSFGSRMTLASNSNFGLFHQDKEAGAIKLELVPSRQLSNDDISRNCYREQAHESPREKQSNECHDTPRKDSKGPLKKCAMSDVVESSSPKLMYVDRVVQEILQTERTYVQDLQSIVEDYLDCISDQSRLALGTEERSALFGNIRDIYHFNSQLLHELENCDNDPVAIAECFVSKSEEFHIYTQYCTNYPRSVAVLTECMRNKIQAKFFRERQEVLQHSLPLGAYLLKPVQRILKYHLLLHEISNHLDKDTEGYDVVLDAIDTMQRVAWHINDMKRKHEHDIRLQEIQSLLTNWKGPDLTSYGELVLEGTFRIQRAKNERTLFLFDRLLLITKKREDTYSYKAHILCCNLMLVEVIPKEPLSFSVFHYKNPKIQHTVQAKSQQDKRLWILHLKRLILENHPAKIPAKAKQAILEMDAIHHPGFSYASEAERKSSATLKDDLATCRVRRKSEPSSNLHKVMKQNDMSPDTQKRISIQSSLLCQAAKLASSEMIRKGVLSQTGNIQNTQDYFDRPYGEGLALRASDQTDADDEEESEQNSLPCSQQKMKGGRKRLNSQVSDNVEKRRSINLSLCDGQNSKDQSDEESSQLNAEQHFPSSRVCPLSRQQGTPQGNSLIMNILGGASTLRNIWTDHQIRQALFPARRHPQDEDDDDYQMFMMSGSASRAQQESGASSRPCSWHLGLMQDENMSGSYGRVVRRASSVGENKSHPRNLRSRQSNYQSSHGELSNRSSEQGQKRSSLDSSEELTIDDIEHVYDNISYEDLKQMGLLRKHDSDFLSVSTASDSIHQCCDSNRGSVASTREKTDYQKGISNSCSQELQIIEENIYDSICLPEQSLEHVKPHSHSKRKQFLGMDSDFQCFGHMNRFVSEESLQFSEDDSSDHRVPIGDGEYFNLLDTSSNSDSVSHKSAADKLSEEVDEIWNDLENYIKKNEEKKNERLLASFPVSKDDINERRLTASVPVFKKDVDYSHSTLCLPENSYLPITNSPNIRKDTMSAKTSTSGSLLSLNRTSLANEMTLVDSSYFASETTLSCSDALSTQGLDSIDKSKNKVFTMARQYSQKIRKANQLLKLKSPEQEQPLCKPQKLKPKDLAAIMEEKKQGGPAIGARIAEYSQLYDQVIFRDSPARMQNEAKDSPKNSPDSRKKQFQQPASPITSRRRSKCLQTDSLALDSTNTNGDVTDFFTWPDFKDFKSKSDYAGNCARSHQKNITNASSVPSLIKLTPKALHSQRWSTVSQQYDENTHQDLACKSLGRRVSCEQKQLHMQPQSSSSTFIHRVEQSTKVSKNMPVQPTPCNFRAMRKPELCNSGDRNIEENVYQEENCEMTLQDSQKVLVLSKLSSLNAQIATLNYFANFKDTEGDGGDDDDDDYVEIKSEDDEEEQEAGSSHRNPRVHQDPDRLQSRCSAVMSCSSFSRPSTPGKPSNFKETSDVIAYEDEDKLSDYLWRPPSSNQQNIVQSLREKFQCLSSSSFA